MDFWTGAFVISVVGVFWLGIVLIVLDVRIVLPRLSLPSWLAALRALFVDQPRVCPDCGRKAVPLGRRQGALWFGCATCDPVRTWTEPEAPAAQQPDLHKRTA